MKTRFSNENDPLALLASVRAFSSRTVLYMILVTSPAKILKLRILNSHKLFNRSVGEMGSVVLTAKL